MDRVFLLDRSGSMQPFLGDTIGGYNSFVDSQRALGGTMTLIQFDTRYTITYNNIPIEQVEPLTTQSYCVGGGTALLDTIGDIIHEFKERKPVVIILTDGEDNSSRVHTKTYVKDLIEQCTNDGWSFVYLGANQDAFAEAGSIGISPTATMNYDQNRTPELFATLSAAASQYASGETQSMTF